MQFIEKVLMMNMDFIIQSIGRPRVSGGVKRIVVHLFYTKDRKWGVGVDKDRLLKFKEAEDLFVSKIKDYQNEFSDPRLISLLLR